MFKLGPDKDSNVFHLSLTEIAFLIILALVLLLGFPLKENLRELDELQNCRLRPEDPSVNVDEPESLLLPCDRCDTTFHWKRQGKFRKSVTLLRTTLRVRRASLWNKWQRL